MTADLDYTIESNGQSFHIHISQPKINRKFRGYVTDATNNQVGAGRWDTVAETKLALQEIADKFSAPKTPRR